MKIVFGLRLTSEQIILDLDICSKSVKLKYKQVTCNSTIRSELHNS